MSKLFCVEPFLVKTDFILPSVSLNSSGGSQRNGKNSRSQRSKRS